MKPFLKWAGGKQQLLEKLIEHFPEEINNYHELFLGGGSVLFFILSLIKNNKIKLKGKVYAYDINKSLISVYKNIQTNYKELFEKVNKILDIYDKCEMTKNGLNRNPTTYEESIKSKENYYYWLRKNYNNIEDKSTLYASSLFIVLNKLCFRGIFREGPNGFNVPFGHYKTTPKIFTLKYLEELNNLLKDVEFQCMDFQESFKNIKKNDFIYLDPPYVPENCKSFVNYTKKGFPKEFHIKLFELIKEYKKESKIIMSNSNTELIYEIFKEYKIYKIDAKRRINSKNPSSMTKEVIVKLF